MSERALFRTDAGLEVPALTRAEAHEVERIAIEQTGPTLLQMLEHAGLGLAFTAIEMLGAGWRDARVLVLAGPGTNGAGGVCAARHLANRGVHVLVVSALHPSSADGALAQQLMALGEAPARLIHFAEAFDVTQFELVLDAVLGPGLEGADLERAPRGPTMALIRAADAAAAPVLSLDIPSGIDADNGDAEGFAVRPSRTLTLGLPKQGLREENAGELWLADLGIPPGVYARAGLAFASPFGANARVRLRYPEAARGLSESAGEGARALRRLDG